MSTILIADSGSTKTDWALLPPVGQSSVPTFVHTQGITPVHQTEDAIRQILLQELKPQLPQVAGALHICFYGSGCLPVHVPMMEHLLSAVFDGATAEAHSDLMGAARALCGHEAGLACILGTGANSCLYDGERILANTPALGYILGDEGSGAVLGRSFFNAIFKNPALADVRDHYLSTTRQTVDDVIRKVYREPMANRFLATASLYIGQHLDHPLLRQLVVDNFRQFFRRNLLPYQRTDLPVHFAGSMSASYPELLAEAAEAEGFKVGRILRSPLEGLIAYHTK